VAIASQGGMNPVFQAGALLHEQRSHPRQLPAGNPNLGQGGGILQNVGAAGNPLSVLLIMPIISLAFRAWTRLGMQPAASLW
jgi:hypothetical protein